MQSLRHDATQARESAVLGDYTGAITSYQEVLLQLDANIAASSKDLFLNSKWTELRDNVRAETRLVQETINDLHQFTVQTRRKSQVVAEKQDKDTKEFFMRGRGQQDEKPYGQR